MINIKNCFVCQSIYIKKYDGQIFSYYSCKAKDHQCYLKRWEKSDETISIEIFDYKSKIAIKIEKDFLAYTKNKINHYNYVMNLYTCRNLSLEDLIRKINIMETFQ
jgi:hypothetical protein